MNFFLTQTIDKTLRVVYNRYRSLVFAMRLRELVDSFGGEVTVRDIYGLYNTAMKKPEKKRYSNSVYNTITRKYKLDMSEKELDDITTKLLEKYFSSHTETK